MWKCTPGEIHNDFLPRLVSVRRVIKTRRGLMIAISMLFRKCCSLSPVPIYPFPLSFSLIVDYTWSDSNREQSMSLCDLKTEGQNAKLCDNQTLQRTIECGTTNVILWLVSGGASAKSYYILHITAKWFCDESFAKRTNVACFCKSETYNYRSPFTY